MATPVTYSRSGSISKIVMDDGKVNVSCHSTVLGHRLNNSRNPNNPASPRKIHPAIIW